MKYVTNMVTELQGNGITNVKKLDYNAKHFPDKFMV